MSDDARLPQPLRTVQMVWRGLPLPMAWRRAATGLAYGSWRRLQAWRRSRAALASRRRLALVLDDGVPSDLIWLARMRPDRIPAGDLIVSGFLSDVTGIGRGGRMSLAALQGAAATLIAHDLRADPTGDGVRRGDGAAPAPGGVWFCHCNPPEALHFMHVSRGRLSAGRYRIGYWAWELPDLPDDWASAIPLFHEIWAPSRFVADAIRRRAPATVKVRVVPHPLPDMSAAVADKTRFGMAADGMAFLSMYDTRSSAARKNPVGAVKAFQLAFQPDDPGVSLMVKVNAPEGTATGLDELEAMIAGWPNIRLFRDTLTDADADHMIASGDVFISLHRAEGFGLSIAQAMAAGRPVVATGWSGNVDFAGNGALLVPCELVPARDPTGRYDCPGQVWADPDLTSAAGCLRELAQTPGLAARLGTAARATVADRLPVRYDLGPARSWLR